MIIGWGHKKAAVKRQRLVDKDTPYQKTRLYDKDEIRRLILQGELSLSEIARILGCSNHPVNMVKKELVELGFLKKGESHVINPETSETE